MSIRRASVAGTWYPGAAPALAAAVDRHLAAADGETTGHLTDLVALIAPHAGLMYSGAVAAHAYRQLRDRPVGLVVLVGPSHFLAFEVWRSIGPEALKHHSVADFDEEAPRPSWRPRRSCRAPGRALRAIIRANQLRF